MARSRPSRPKIEIPAEEVERLHALARGRIGLASAIAAVVLGNRRLATIPESLAGLWMPGGVHDAGDELLMAFEEALGRPVCEVHTVDDFWTPAVAWAFGEVVGPEVCMFLRQILDLVAEGAFGFGWLRRSCHARDFALYAYSAMFILADNVGAICCGRPVAELLYRDYSDIFTHFEFLIAIAVRNGDADVIAYLKDAIYGDNAASALDHHLVRGIVRSGNEELVGDLLRLLDAAREQEGVRQVILEQADCGTRRTLERILSHCVERDLFRFSAALRAFGTWCGLPLPAMKGRRLARFAGLALRALDDKAYCLQLLESGNIIEVHLGLWALGVDDLALVTPQLECLVTDPVHVRRVLGWYFIRNITDDAYRMSLAMRHLDERDPETLAWAISNLAVLDQALRGRYRSVDAHIEPLRPCPDEALPSDAAERARLFFQLKGIAQEVGRKKRTFSDSPYAEITITLSVDRVIQCMMSVALYDLNPALVQELYGMLGLMNVDLKWILVYTFLSPDTVPADHQLLLDLLGDRTVATRQLAVDRLSRMRVGERDLDALGNVLSSKSSSLREGVMGILTAQSWDKLKGVTVRLLQANNAYQNQAGIELVLRARKERDASADAAAFADDEALSLALGELSSRDVPAQTRVLLDGLGLGESEAEAYTPENGYGLYDPEEALPFEERYVDLFEAAPLFQGGSEKVYAGERQAVVPPGVQDVGAPDPGAQGLDAHDPARRSGFLFRALRTLFGDGDSAADGEPKAKGQAGAARELVTQDGTHLLTPTKLKDYADYEGAADALLRIAGVIERHEDYEYEVEGWNGARETQLLGSTGDYVSLPVGCGAQRAADKDARLGMLPFADEFREAIAPVTTGAAQALRVVSATLDRDEPPSTRYQFVGRMLSLRETYDKTIWPWEVDQLGKGRALQAEQVLWLSLFEVDQDELVGEALRLYRSFLRMYGRCAFENCLRRVSQMSCYDYGSSDFYPINARWLRFWRMVIRRLELTDEQYRRWFELEYCVERANGSACDIELGLDLKDYARALGQSMIGEGAFYRFVFTAPAVAWKHVAPRTSQARRERARMVERYPFVQDLCDRAISRIVDVEERRGELETPVSKLAFRIVRVQHDGARHFCNLLKALGNDTLTRDCSRSKRDMLIDLLEACQPAPEDTATSLSVLLRSAGISDERLVQATMLAPQWAGLAEQVSGWDALKSGIWFFHAHVSEDFSAATETEVARYSSILPQQFNDGQFDREWFLDVYQRLGDARFKVLYRAAKYLSIGNSLHRRSRLFVDAALGRVDEKALEEEIEQKRNQDKLRSYPLIPYEGTPQETLHRYQFIRHFEAGSVRFGAMRKSSEKRAVEAALANLARCAGFSDVDRLVWRMEGTQIEGMRESFEPHVVEDYEVWIAFDDTGCASLAVRKGKRLLRSVPRAIAKDSYVVGLKSQVKDLRAQQKRGRAILERAMVEQSSFTADELPGILANPVIGAMMERLVLTDGTHSVWAQDFGDLDAGVLRIAHPFDLKQQGVWSRLMGEVFERAVVQPFKQVFRELYLLTADERQERTISRRYAGNQIQPQKAATLLKSRGWTVDYETGLQKVWYDQDLVACMVSYADWFSPADIEPPVIEEVNFFGRGTWKAVLLEEIAPIVFSETMRDVDLVVSVAHAGAVDPETSSSTIEMRRAILGQLLDLLKVRNVDVDGSHAKVHGTLGNYSIHLGSGVVHKMGTGMICMLPVHSQTRGRLFLPFADEDPKTAEVLSKVLLLARDQMIKDPEILRQITE